MSFFKRVYMIIISPEHIVSKAIPISRNSLPTFGIFAVVSSAQSKQFIVPVLQLNPIHTLFLKACGKFLSAIKSVVRSPRLKLCLAIAFHLIFYSPLITHQFTASHYFWSIIRESQCIYPLFVDIHFVWPPYPKRCWQSIFLSIVCVLNAWENFQGSNRHWM